MPGWPLDGLVLRQQDAGELPAFGIEADGGCDHAGPACDLAVARDLGRERRREVGIKRDVPLLLDSEAGFAPASLARIERDAGFDRGAPETVGHGLVAPLDHRIAKSLVLLPEIERGIFVGDGAEPAALAQQKTLEVKSGNGVPDGPARALRARG